MEEGDGALDLKTRSDLAIKAFDLTAAYDAAIQQYLQRSLTDETFPPRFLAPTGAGEALRYGENPHQGAVFYRQQGIKEPCAALARQRSGKKLSYNNLLDTDAAFELVKEFKEPAAVIVKHTNPCGAATAEDPMEAFRAAYQGDPISAFGGIAALNRPVTEALAEEIADPSRFLEVLIAPDCEPGALKILKKKVRWGKNLRVLATGSLEIVEPDSRCITFRSVVGGVLAQSRDVGFERESMDIVTQAAPDEETLDALRFAWRVVKHVKSNAIVLARGTKVVGVGAGQMSRIDSANHAGKKAGARCQGAVMASDAFFPFRDCVDLAADLGVTAIIQPGGSVRDEESIEAANEHGIAMVFTGFRHFRH
jgi:phosphoribosylaminoimidazolecarboxamide formyltransferase/IMP cyclohydrolase